MRGVRNVGSNLLKGNYRLVFGKEGKNVPLEAETRFRSQQGSAKFAVDEKPIH